MGYSKRCQHLNHKTDCRWRETLRYNCKIRAFNTWTVRLNILNHLNTSFIKMACVAPWLGWILVHWSAWVNLYYQAKEYDLVMAWRNLQSLEGLILWAPWNTVFVCTAKLLKRETCIKVYSSKWCPFGFDIAQPYPLQQVPSFNKDIQRHALNKSNLNYGGKRLSSFVEILCFCSKRVESLI